MSQNQKPAPAENAVEVQSLEPESEAGLAPDGHSASEAESSDAEASVSAEGADLTAAELEKLRETLNEREDAMLRLQAEMDNVRKRSAREVENAHKYGVERLVNELLPLRDSMELGIQASMQDSANVETLREGAELTLKMLTSALEKFNVEILDPTDDKFDPEFHQAISTQEVVGRDSGTVLQVVQKGVTLHGRLVRPAMVIVAA
jgi:molecular chaperone GrpE